MVDLVSPCSFSSAGNGRTTAAEWIRTAYHDMATADVVAGTGGIDASIMYETERSENVGAAFNSTFGGLQGFFTTRSSASDLIALSVYFATRSCKGPSIPFRAGRIDATGPGALGVPEPTDDLTTTQDKFTRQGFNTTDMIALVACGHTVGGVHGSDFPTVVPGSGTDGNNFSHFDTTTKFDNKIAIEFIAGNSTDPLLVGPDATRNSDKRVFEADGNVTMNLLTDATTFKNRCQSVMQRMIDTVPATVTLTAPIEPYEIKPGQLQMTLSSDGSNFIFSGEIRVRTTVRPSSNITSLKLVYADRNGVNTGSINASDYRMFDDGQAYGLDDSFQVPPTFQNNVFWQLMI